MVDQKPNISIIILTFDGQNIPLKRQKLSQWIFFKKGKTKQTKLKNLKNKKEKQLYGSHRKGPTIQAESKYTDKNIPCKQ